MRQLDVRWTFGLLFLIGLGLGACASPEAPVKMASAHLLARSGSSAEGHVHFHQVGDKVHIAYEIEGLPAKSKHGFHLHEKGDCSAADASSAGGHYNPGNQKHGSPDGNSHHLGDFGNITANEKGVAKGELILNGVKIAELQGHAVIIHEKEDDLNSQPAGNAGARVACGVVN